MQHIPSKWLYSTILTAFLSMAGTMTAQAELQYIDGGATTLKKNVGNGKWTLVMIWASDCHICNREAHEYVDFHFVHSDDDATVLGISMDGQAKKAEANKFISKHKVNFPNLIGEPEEVANLYYKTTGEQFVGTPSFLLYDPKGEIQATNVGPLPTDLIEKFIAEKTLAAKQK